MSLRVQHRASCSRKKKLTEEGAERAVRLVLKIHGLSVMPYKCRHCGGWHIGKTLAQKEALRGEMD